MLPHLIMMLKQSYVLLSPPGQSLALSFPTTVLLRLQSKKVPNVPVRSFFSSLAIHYSRAPFTLAYTQTTGSLLKCRFWSSKSGGRAQESAFLTNLQVMLILLVQDHTWTSTWAWKEDVSTLRLHAQTVTREGVGTCLSLRFSGPLLKTLGQDSFCWMLTWKDTALGGTTSHLVTMRESLSETTTNPEEAEPRGASR